MGHWGTCPQASNRKFFRKNKITQFKHIFSWALHPMAINCPYYLCPKCTKTRLRASVSSKFFWVITPDPLLKGRGGKAKGRVGLEGMEGREWEGKTDEGEGKEGEGGNVKGCAP
jgi:hypothetical protein